MIFQSTTYWFCSTYFLSDDYEIEVKYKDFIDVESALAFGRDEVSKLICTKNQLILLLKDQTEIQLENKNVTFYKCKEESRENFVKDALDFECCNMTIAEFLELANLYECESLQSLAYGVYPPLNLQESDTPVMTKKQMEDDLKKLISKKHYEFAQYVIVALSENKNNLQKLIKNGTDINSKTEFIDKADVTHPFMTAAGFLASVQQRKAVLMLKECGADVSAIAFGAAFGGFIHTVYFQYYPRDKEIDTNIMIEGAVMGGHLGLAEKLRIANYLNILDMQEHSLNDEALGIAEYFRGSYFSEHFSGGDIACLVDVADENHPVFHLPYLYKLGLDLIHMEHLISIAKLAGYKDYATYLLEEYNALCILLHKAETKKLKTILKKREDTLSQVLCGKFNRCYDDTVCDYHRQLVHRFFS